MALLELDQSAFTRANRLDMHALLESWLPGFRVPRREDYLVSTNASSMCARVFGANPLLCLIATLSVIGWWSLGTSKLLRGDLRIGSKHSRGCRVLYGVEGTLPIIHTAC